MLLCGAPLASLTALRILILIVGFLATFPLLSYATWAAASREPFAGA